LSKREKEREREHGLERENRPMDTSFRWGNNQSLALPRHTYGTTSNKLNSKKKAKRERENKKKERKNMKDDQEAENSKNKRSGLQLTIRRLFFLRRFTLNLLLIKLTHQLLTNFSNTLS